MTPNIIISSTFDEASHAKKKTSAKSKKSPDSPARLSPVPSLVVSDDESTLGQADRDPCERGTDRSDKRGTDRQAASLRNYYVLLCGKSVQFKL